MRDMMIYMDRKGGLSMKRWLNKMLVIFVTIITLGFYVPADLLEVDAENNKNNIPKSNVDDESSEDSLPGEALTKDEALSVLSEQAKEQTLKKFGPRITPQVEDEFYSRILPNIEIALNELIEKTEGDYRSLSITEEPAKGYGERIFHVYNEETGQDIALFHVRRDNRPLEGYYFNFHYHIKDDEFKEHHTIGEIYWDKNTPPKWMS